MGHIGHISVSFATSIATRNLTHTLILSLLYLFVGCNETDEKSKPVISEVKKESPIVTSEILIQPFSDFPVAKTQYIKEKIEQYLPNTKILPAISLPVEAYYKPRNRYRADSLIHWLRKRITSDQFIVGLTTKDISTTKPPNPDSGIFGLGFLDGPACMISTFRLKKNSNEQLFKTVIHELGHNFGLDHCPEKSCFMRDAEGKNPLDEEKDFCPVCKDKLVKDGWIF